MATGAFGSEQRHRNQLFAVEGLSSELGAATASSGAATLNDYMGKITSESLTTAQNATYTLTVTNDKVAAGDIVLASVANGTNTQGTVVLLRVTPAAGSFVVVIANKHDSAQAFNGTLVVSFVVVKAL